ncbi:protein fem-1 homolog A-like [Dysidea avara]|uniref:protein fem-1 homolog A-like n=1 Tax=Dysidea avara TaxID=196820 RepID=UPI00331AFB81
MADKENLVIPADDLRDLTNYLRTVPTEHEGYEYTKQWVDKVVTFPFTGQIVLANDALNCAPFVTAAQYGNVPVVKYFLQRFAGLFDINHTGTIVSLTTLNQVEGATALWGASTRNHVEVVKMLLDAGADVNKPTAIGSTPLRGAAFNGHCDTMNVLIEHGADLNYANVLGQSPLLTSIMRGHLEAAKLLLDKGAQQDTKTIHNHSVMHAAAAGGDTDILKMLLDCGIKAEFYLEHDFEHFKESACPAILAASSGRIEAVEYLCGLEQCPPECRSEAYLLLGATLAETSRNVFSGDAKQYWVKALQVRESCGYKPKFLPPTEALYNLTEIQCMEDLEIEFPYPLEMDKWYGIQSLIIRERIMGYSDTILINYLVRRGIIYCRLQDIKLSELLWRKAITSMYRYSNKIDVLGPSLVDGIQKEVNRHLMFMVDGLYAMTQDYQYEPAFAEFMEFILHHLDHVQDYPTKDDNDFNTTLQLALYLVYIWLRYDTYMLKDNRKWSEKCSQLGQRLVSSHLYSPKGSTLLHMAVSDFSVGGKSTFYTAVAEDTGEQLSLLVTALLQWGADKALYDVDSDGNRPIHIATTTCHLNSHPELIPPFLQHGCSPYVVNAAGEDAVLLAKVDRVKASLFGDGPMSLASQCCRTLVQYGIDCNSLPTHIKNYVSLFDKNTIAAVN